MRVTPGQLTVMQGHGCVHGNPCHRSCGAVTNQGWCSITMIHGVAARSMEARSAASLQCTESHVQDRCFADQGGRYMPHMDLFNGHECRADADLVRICFWTCSQLPWGVNRPHDPCMWSLHQGLTKGFIQARPGRGGADQLYCALPAVWSIYGVKKMVCTPLCSTE